MRILPTIFSFSVMLSFVFLVPPQITFSQGNPVTFHRGQYVLCEKRDNLGTSSPSSSGGHLKKAKEPFKKISSERPIIIHSNTLEVDQNLRVIVFKGKVRATTEDMVVECQKMIVYYLADPNKKNKSNLESNRIEKIIALGDVVINRSDGGMAQAGKAVFYQNEEKIVLTENPVVKQGLDFVEGHRIIMFLSENRSIIEGGEKKRVKATIFPKEEKGK